MEPLVFLRVTPVITAIAWLALAAYHIVRGRFRTWTEALVLATTLSVGGYALADLVLFNAGTASVAEIAVRASLTFRTLLASSFLLFAAVLHGRMHRWFALLAVPSGAAIVLIWTDLVSGTTATAGLGIPFQVQYDPVPYAAWFAYALGCGLVGLGFLAWTYIEVRRVAPALGHRMLLEFTAVLVALAIGEGVSISAAGLSGGLPVLSSLLAIPGIAEFVAQSPQRETPFLEAARRWKARDYRVKAAILTDASGILLGSARPVHDPAIDGAFLSATLAVIQDFLATSFPALAGRQLQSIGQGEYTFILERGNATCLTLLLVGKENDQLRRLMREVLKRYEGLNREAFDHWRGNPDDVQGTDQVLAPFVLGPT